MTVMSTQPKYLKTALFTAFSAALVALAAGCGLGDHLSTHREMRSYAKAHTDRRDMATERTSDDGLYRISFEPQPEAIPLSRMHAWTLRVTAPDGRAVEGASISVDGGMPEHGHGLPTRPEVTQSLGNGAYVVEGMKFQMPGWWIVRFDVTSAEGSDSVTFNLML